MIASVSSAAGESRRGRSANWARSIASAYSRRVRNCQPCAISTSSTPWSTAANPSRNSASAACTAASPAAGSSVRSSSTVSGRDDANSAASNSFARGLTADLDRGERALLVYAQGPTLGELQQRDEYGQHVDDGGALAHGLQPAKLRALRQQRLQPGGRPFHIQRPRQQHLRLDPQQPRRHLEVVRRLVQPQLADHREELIGDLRDRQVGDVELVLVDQVQQQIQGARELLQLDDEAVLVLHDGTRGP